ncbi:hypothetical protein EB796_020154 [Bugula neritina]|uniref:Uncharacterized protein n=1 Tax=Bugula neritina TaxID=10212 RepID=A0A7J7J5X4_BUGNE|nr:hypothetical protein EB796_020154 [Bugula neritina]
MTLTNQDITVTQAFVFISLLNRLRVPLGILPYCLKYIAEGYSACKRIKVRVYYLVMFLVIHRYAEELKTYL